MARKSSLRNEAFSLVELLVCIAVLSTGIIFILQALSFSTRTAGLQNDFIEAAFLSKDKLQELDFKEAYGLLKNQPLKEELTKGKFNLSYELILNTETNLYLCDLKISWKRAKRDESMEISTIY